MKNCNKYCHEEMEDEQIRRNPSFNFLFCSQEMARAGLGTGRRWTSLRQHPRPPAGFEAHTDTSTPSTASPLPEVPRKSNWEVIEHFTGGSKGKGSLSSSLVAVGEVARSSIAKDDSSAPSPSLDPDAATRTQSHDAESALLVGENTAEAHRQDTICSKLASIFRRLFSTHQFRNLQVRSTPLMIGCR